jgi:hypothetical protein
MPDDPHESIRLHDRVSFGEHENAGLNAGYEPLSVVSFKRALVLVMNGRAVIVESDNSHPVRSPDGTWERPSVIVLTVT